MGGGGGVGAGGDVVQAVRISSSTRKQIFFRITDRYLFFKYHLSIISLYKTHWPLGDVFVDLEGAGVHEFP